MKQADFLIIGGSAAGTTAAEVIRGLKPESSITIISDEPHEEYSRVLLPQYITHKVSREQIFLKKSVWYEEKKIELLKGSRVQGLAASEKTVTLESGEQIQYGKLLIAIGGDVLRLSVPGSDLGNIMYLRTVENADKFIEVARASKKAVIVGGGLVSLDFAEGFRANGVWDITILIREPYYWAGKLDEPSSKILQGVLEKNGIKVLANEEVDRFESVEARQGPTLSEGRTLNKTVGAVVTKSGKTLDADVVGIGIGIKSDLSWLDGTGINLNRAIVTNEYLETSLLDVYAAGDCAEFKDVIFDRQHVMGNWANATTQGADVGKTMAGVRTVYESASSYTDTFFEGRYTFVGVTDDKFADEVVSRGSVESGKMTRIFIKKLSNPTSEVDSDSSEVRKSSDQIRIVGATIINDPAEVAPLTAAVKNKIDISSHKEKLGDANFDLKELI